MITTTEFFLFIGWVLAIVWGFHWKSEAKKSHRLIIEMFENDTMRERIVKDFQLFKKSIIKDV
jgi:hypothetical protein